MVTDPEKIPKIKAFFVISALYLPFLILVSGISGHWHHLGDATLFFAWWTDAQGYKAIADYYTSLGNSERPSDYLLLLRPFVFPLYLSVYHLIGIAGVQILQMMMNAASLWLVFLSSKTLSNRSWIAALCTVLLALTPSFGFLVFHAMTESLSIFLVCLFITLMIDHFKNRSQSSLFWATLVVSILLCVRPIILPFWILLMVYYMGCSLREPLRNMWGPIAATVPVLAQFMITFLLTGTPTLSPSGSVAISGWYFPIVYGEKEYGRFVGRKSEEAAEGLRRFPELKEKVTYLVRNYREAIRTYVYLLVGEHLTTGSNYVRTHTETDARNESVLAFLQTWAIHLNRVFACIHVIMLALMVGLILVGVKVYEQKIIFVLYVFAMLLILPAGLTYWQGDRYVLLAEPLWLVAHAFLVGLFLDLVMNHGRAKLQRGGLHHSPETTVAR